MMTPKTTFGQVFRRLDSAIRKAATVRVTHEKSRLPRAQTGLESEDEPNESSTPTDKNRPEAQCDHRQLSRTRIP